MIHQSQIVGINEANQPMSTNSIDALSDGLLNK
ncbi:hypothetical protein IWQ47_001194 [Aquimarina sp. EL_43]|nr:hypothetical protein [Aquimarina sp. EL_35]MBG6150568.1 hypothetical protein [Aquimarina sp. EL_32]MBG6168124.1 hypothetical protein [Aquimarina sp. EL_43]